MCIGYFLWSGSLLLVVISNCSCADVSSCVLGLSYWMALITLIIDHVRRVQCPLWITERPCRINLIHLSYLHILHLKGTVPLANNMVPLEVFWLVGFDYLGHLPLLVVIAFSLACVLCWDYVGVSCTINEWPVTPSEGCPKKAPKSTTGAAPLMAMSWMMTLSKECN